MEINVEKIRQDFPLLATKIRGREIHYLDNGASTQKPKQVIDRIKDFYEKENANIHRGLYHLSEKATNEFEKVREKVAKFIGAPSAKEIIFTSGSTASINMVVYGWAEKFFKKGDTILLTDMEHHSNLVPWIMLAKRKELNVEYIPLTSDYTLDYGAFEEIISSGHIKLLACTHVSNVLGTINPLKEMIEIAGRYKVVTVIDGAQAVPHMPVNVADLKCDFYVFSGHKMIGPTGTGVLYGRHELLEEMDPLFFGGDMISMVKKDKVLFAEVPIRFEGGTPNIAGVIGLGAAIDYLKNLGMQNIASYEHKLGKFAAKRLNDEFADDITIYGPNIDDSTQKSAGIISFDMKDIHPHDVAAILDESNVCVRSGHHCAQPLIDAIGVHALTRASFYFYNTEADVEALISGLHKVKSTFA